jgi:hypothetical protein
VGTPTAAVKNPFHEVFVACWVGPSVLGGAKPKVISVNSPISAGFAHGWITGRVIEVHVVTARRAAAVGAQRIRSKMARAVEMATIMGAERVD